MATTEEKLSIDRAAASTLVAFESLTKRTPPIVATGSITCSSPVNPSSARAIAAAVSAGERRDRAGRHHVAQQVPSRRDEPRSAAPAARRRRSALPDEAAIRENVGAGRRVERVTDLPCRALTRASASAAALSALTTAQSSAVWLAKIALLRRGVGRHRRMAIEVVRREVQERGDPRMKACRWSRAGSCSPRPRARCRRWTTSTWALSGTPMLPPTSTRLPAASSIRPTSVVVVDLPLVPVIATTRPAQPARGELQLADHRHAAPRARATLRQLDRHAGAEHDQVGAGERVRRGGRRARAPRRGVERVAIGNRRLRGRSA